MKPQFFELEGDYSHLHGVYINGEPEHKTYPDVSADEHARLVSDHEIKVDILNDMIYHQDGTHKVKFLEPNQPTKDWDHYVECGFIP